MTLQTIFRLFHILAGIMWVGGTVFIAAILLPAARGVGPASIPMMREMATVRKLPVYLQSMAGITIVFGLLLAWRDTADEGMKWFEHGIGLYIGFGAVVAVIAFGYGISVNAPAAKKLGAIATQIQSAGRAPTPEEAQTMKAIQDKMYTASRIVAVMLLVASAAMASARYM